MPAPNNTINASTNPDANSVAFTAEANKKQDVILRRYMAASSIAQKQMLDSGDLAKELKAAGPATGGKIEELYNQQDSATNGKYDLRRQEDYDKFVDDKVIERCREYNKKGYDKNKREWASTIAAESYDNLKNEGFYKKQGYLPGAEGGTRGGTWWRGKEGQVRGLRNAGKGNILSNKNTFGKNFTIDPETRAVTARPTGITRSPFGGKIFNSRKQAKSAFQGLIAAGSMGKPLIFTLDTNNEKLARDQIRQLTEEAVARGVPLDQITIKTPGLANTEPMKLDKIVADAANNIKSQYEQQNFFRTGKLGIRAAGYSALGEEWGNKIVKKGGLDPERTDKYLNGGPYDRTVESGFVPESEAENYLQQRQPSNDQKNAPPKNISEAAAIKDSARGFVVEDPKPNLEQAAGAGPSQPQASQGQPKNVIRYKAIELPDDDPSQNLRYAAQVEKDKAVLKTDINEKYNEYQKSDQLVRKLDAEIKELQSSLNKPENPDKDTVKVGGIFGQQMNKAEIELKKSKKEKEKENAETDRARHASDTLESYNLYKVLDGEPDEQIEANSEEAVKVMDQTKSERSYLSTSIDDENIKGATDRGSKLEDLGKTATSNTEEAENKLKSVRRPKAPPFTRPRAPLYPSTPKMT